MISECLNLIHTPRCRYATVSGLTAGNYSFAVVACTSAGCTSSVVTTGTVALQPPVAVGTPSVGAIGARMATVLWAAASSGDLPVVYNVELQQCVYFAIVDGVGTTCGGPTRTAFVSSSSTTYNMNSLLPSTVYRTRVSAQNAAGATASEWATFTTTAGLAIRGLNCSFTSSGMCGLPSSCFLL